MDNIVILDDDPKYNKMTTTDYVSQAIEKMGGTCIHLRLADLVTKKSAISIDYDSDKQHIIFKKDGKVVNLTEEITSVLCWRPKMPKEIIKQIKEKKTREFYQGEWSVFLTGLFLSLQHCFWMNPYPQNMLLEEKAFQLKVAQQLGFHVPKTFLTTSLDEAYHYFESTDKKIIYKPLSQTMWEKKEKDDTKPACYAIYTTVIDKNDLLDSKDVHATPNIFQTYVEKKIELRITCVGKAVMACEIHSQDSKISSQDWRRYDIGNTRYKKHTLPQDIEQLCLKLLDTLKLTYGCIDMIVTPDDEYVFLELNPNGQYGWIEGLTGLPITENIARMLMARSINYDIKRW